MLRSERTATAVSAAGQAERDRSWLLDPQEEGGGMWWREKWMDLVVMTQ